MEAPVKIELKTSNENKTKVFQLEGELDVHQAKTLKSDIIDSLEDSGWTYELDMDKVTYLDSSGLGMLVYLKKEIGKRQGQFKISNLNEPVLNVFKLTKLDTFFGLK